MLRRALHVALGGLVRSKATDPDALKQEARIVTRNPKPLKPEALNPKPPRRQKPQAGLGSVSAS